MSKFANRSNSENSFSAYLFDGEYDINLIKRIKLSKQEEMDYEILTRWMKENFESQLEDSFREDF